MGVFQTFYEGGRMLRMTLALVSRALEAANEQQWQFDSLWQQGMSRQGTAANIAVVVASSAPLLASCRRFIDMKCPRLAFC